ncbi:hypothetical protein [Mycolicibacter kumamotonensis]|jgi:hypothetical protein|uniref:Uncharacterized protein n=1 Tax=Mycolicibacter kumamotonensis TaxID=354243 RepID=A0A1B8SE48_9MYCO|nr:hypothetical protein [Mycolicibacter kumamotonensis]NDJ91756.1 hypothetical protein [Mycolicibacter kumamotonensis]OBY30999.1 hypothetical protein ACT18_14785 [Mycolicibacter kumamotonensis]ORA83417.1 hypothetical protein BST28_00530 [Mycolicibacter kumamotonensis]
MTTAERPPQQVVIAGVPWPAYKVVALAIGLVTLVGVGAATASAAAAVLSAAAVCTAVWLILGPLLPSRR